MHISRTTTIQSKKAFVGCNKIVFDFFVSVLEREHVENEDDDHAQDQEGDPAENTAISMNALCTTSPDDARYTQRAAHDM